MRFTGPFKVAEDLIVVLGRATFFDQMPFPGDVRIEVGIWVFPPPNFIALPIAAENNIELLIENIDPEENPKYFLTSSAEGFDIVHSVGNPHVKFLYDFFHEQIAEGNLIEKLEKNIDLVGLVHIADVPGRHHPGTGEINYANIYRKLAELHYSRYAAMEFHPLGDPIKELREARELAISSARSARAARSFESESGRKYESA